MAPYNTAAVKALAEVLENNLKQGAVVPDGPAKTCSAVRGIALAGEAGKPYIDLLERVVKDGPQEVRPVAERALVALRGTGRLSPNSIQKIRESSDVTALTALLNDSDFDLREAAARGLRAQGPRAASATKALADSIISSRASPTTIAPEGSAEYERTRSAALHARGAAIYAIRDIGPAAVQEALPSLLVAMKDEHPWIRTISVETLGMVTADSAIARNHLRDALKDSDPKVQKLASAALARAPQ
jgi:HEAT repeat protein